MPESFEPRQWELVCTECPLSSGCDESSVFCALSWLRGGNDAQRKLINMTHRSTKTPTAKTLKRREYFAERYRRQRDQVISTGTPTGEERI